MKSLTSNDLTGAVIGDKTGRLLRAINTLGWRHRVRQIESVIEGVQNYLSREATPNQLILGERLKKEISDLSANLSDTTDHWREVCASLQRYSQTSDPLDFIDWPPIKRAIGTNSSSTVIASFLALRRSSEWKSRWRPVLRHRRFGRQPAFLLYPSTSPIAVQHAAHLHFFNAVTGRQFLDADCVVDLGAGYGCVV